MCVCRRRKRTASRRSSRLDAAGRSRTQAKLSVSNFYDLYDSIEMARSPSVLLPLTPTSIIKHSDLLNAQQLDEYVPMKVPSTINSFLVTIIVSHLCLSRIVYVLLPSGMTKNESVFLLLLVLSCLRYLLRDYLSWIIRVIRTVSTHSIC